VAEDIYKEIASQIPELEKRIDEAKDYITALAETGEDVSQLRVELRQLESRLARWKAMLRKRKALP